ncbi:MAG: TIM-barrel signal transduction protein, partial [uncultured Thermomicrobiales bacterium]
DLQLGPVPDGRPRLAGGDDALRRRQRDRRRDGRGGA